MKNLLEHNQHYGTFLRVRRDIAEQIFDTGATIEIMTSDRTPATSPGTEIYYKKGCKAEYFYDEENGEKGVINSLWHVLQDFAEFLCCDGYGHMPQPGYANNEWFSYWVKLENTKIGWN